MTNKLNVETVPANAGYKKISDMYIRRVLWHELPPLKEESLGMTVISFKGRFYYINSWMSFEHVLKITPLRRKGLLS